MFRLISSNTLAGLRPILLRKVRGNTPGLKLATNANLDPGLDVHNHFALHISRGNATKTGAQGNGSASAAATYPDLHDRLVQPRVSTEAQVVAQVARFTEVVASGNDSPETLNELKRLFANDAVKEKLPRDALHSYAELLNRFTTANRNSRLSRKQNRDSDQYTLATLSNDILVKLAILECAEAVISGVVGANLASGGLRLLFLAMLQTECFAEMLELWEAGVNDERTSKLYLNHAVLALVLPVAYKTGRFSYDDILSIFDYNTRRHPNETHYTLLTALGKVAILAGDNARGLDMMEALMKVYEQKPHAAKPVLHCLGDLHLNFIGHCSDIKVAKHFFDKVVQFDLPYRVTLKAPYVVSMLENCHSQGEPLETMVSVWKTALQYYARANKPLNSRYSILNLGFFNVFFKVYPDLSETAYSSLREMIAIYATIKPVDEFLINAILSHYSWKDKTVYRQILANFETHAVPRSQVSYRVALKNMGNLENVALHDILAQWYQSLANLDNEGYTYIPIADWAALRDCTILSPHADSRSDLYLKVLQNFKDFHQDDKACVRFARYWLPRDHVRGKVAAISFDQCQFDCDLPVPVPNFQNLRENVNYRAVTRPVFS